MPFKLVLFVAGIGLAGTVAAWGAAATGGSFECGFEAAADFRAWSGWAPDGAVSVTAVQPGCHSPAAAAFASAGGGFNTPVVAFEPPLSVTAEMVVQFDLWIRQAGRSGMNIRCLTDGAEYYLAFSTTAGGQWNTVRAHLKDALYKRDGKPGVRKDGLTGKQIASLQIVTGGPDVRLDNFKIYPAPESVTDLPAPAPALRSSVLRNYPAANAVFPFGVISTVNGGDRVNATYFGQSTAERLENDLLDLKTHYLDTIVNFCDDDEVDARLKLMDTYGLYLVETGFSNADFRTLPEQAPAIGKIKSARAAKRLLAWYGKDEPSDAQAYLDNKLKVNAIDPDHPYVSALCDPTIIRELGPHLEIAMIDPYLVRPGPVTAAPMLNIMENIRQARQFVGGKRVWLIAQSFSLRHSNTPALRYPTPEEARFGVYSALAAGAKGILFFIYNDTVSYLDGIIRGEEFDDTLVDPWGNDNPTYREIARLGKTLLPVLPLLAGAEEIPETTISLEYPRDQLIAGTFATRYGTLVLLANQDLQAPFKGEITMTAPKDENVYDLIRLKQVNPRGKARLELLPGDGVILLVASPANYDAARTAITSNGVKTEKEVLAVELDALQRAGLAVAPIRTAMNECHDLESLTGLRQRLEQAEQAHRDYWQAKVGLEEAQQTFGRIHAAIRGRITTLDTTKDPKWLAVFDRLKTMSRDYFRCRREWRSGTFHSPDHLAKLRHDLPSLEYEVKTLMANTGTGKNNPN